MNVPDVNQINAATALVSAIAAGVTAVLGFFFGHKHGRRTEQDAETERKSQKKQ